MNPYVNYGLWVVTCQCRFIDCNKSTTLVGDVHSVGGYACGDRGYLGIVCTLLNFFVVNLNCPKISLKKKIKTKLDRG